MNRKLLFFIAMCGIFHQLFSQKYIAAAKKDSLWGFIDETGAMVIPFQYNFAYNFSCGRALVKQLNQWKYIDLKNNSISEGKNYQCKTSFANNRAIVIDNETQKKAIINLNGDIVYRNKEVTDIQGYYSGMARVMMNGQYGFIDTNGIMKIQARYYAAHRFSGSGKNTLALVKRLDQWLYITTNGTEILPPDGYLIRDYMSLTKGIYEFGNNDTVLLMVRKIEYLGGGTDTYFGYMNKYGQIVVPPKLSKAENFREGLAAVSIDGKLWGYINTRGEVILDFKYKQARAFSGGIALCKTDKKLYIKQNGALLCGVQTINARYSFKNGFARVESGKLYGFIDDNCNLRVPYTYIKTKDFFCGFAWVRTNEGWGVIDTNGKLVVAPVYKDSRSFVPVNSASEEEEEEEEN